MADCLLVTNFPPFLSFSLSHSPSLSLSLSFSLILSLVFLGPLGPEWGGPNDQLLNAEVPSKSGQWRPDWRRKNMLEKSPRHSEQAEMQRTEKEFLEIRCFETAFCLESGRNLPGNFTGSGRYFDVRKLVSGATFWPNLGPWGPQTTPKITKHIEFEKSGKTREFLFCLGHFCFFASVLQAPCKGRRRKGQSPCGPTGPELPGPEPLCLQRALTFCTSRAIFRSSSSDGAGGGAMGEV